MVTNAEALEAWFGEVEASKSPVMAALAETLAAAIDSDSNIYCDRCHRSATNGALVREYRQTLAALIVQLAGDEEDGQAPLFSIVRASLGDETDAGTQDVGAGAC